MNLIPLPPLCITQKNFPNFFFKNTNICLTFVLAMVYNAGMHLKRSIPQLNKRAFYESIKISKIGKIEYRAVEAIPTHKRSS